MFTAIEHIRLSCETHFYSSHIGGILLSCLKPKRSRLQSRTGGLNRGSGVHVTVSQLFNIIGSVYFKKGKTKSVSESCVCGVGCGNPGECLWVNMNIWTQHQSYVRSPCHQHARLLSCSCSHVSCPPVWTQGSPLPSLTSTSTHPAL